MNLLYNPIVRGGSLIVVIASVLILSSSASTQAIGEGLFCKGLTSSATKVTNSISAAREKLKTAQTEQANKLKDLQTKWENELNNSREKWDTKRQEQFTKLENLAKTDSQKSAVTAYQNAITTAVTARRSANDTARADFRKDVENLISAKKSNMDAQYTILNSAVSNAITAAEAACTSENPNISEIRSTLQSSIKSARETYSNARKTDTKIGDQIKQLAQTRNDNIKANDEAFKKAAEAARTELNSAFAGTEI